MENIQVKQFLKAIHPVEETILDEYMDSWEVVSYPRKTIITSEGQTEKYIYIVLEGIQKSYYTNDNRDHVIAFTYPPSFSGIPESFYTQSPSKYFLETISESRMLRLSYHKQQAYIQKHRPLETLFRKGAEMLLVGVLERHYELMAFSIEDRFKAFTKRSAHLLHMVPHKDIASYLRIDPSNFSKLLNNVQI